MVLVTRFNNRKKSCGFIGYLKSPRLIKFYSVSEFHSVQSQITSILLMFDFELIAENDFDYFQVNDQDKRNY
jgi:hypothetical protein